MISLRQSMAALSRGKKFRLVIALGIFLSSLCLGWATLRPAAAPQRRGLFLVYGPVDFTRGVGVPAPGTQSFTLPSLATEYRLQIFNGGLNEQFDAVSSAVVTVNGREVFSPSDFNQKTRLLEKPFAAAPDNSVTVELRAAPKSGLTLQVVGVDNDAPGINASLDPSPNANGWNNRDVTVSFACDDPLSGIEKCPSPVVLTAEGQGQTVTGTAIDRAQNSGQVSLTVNIDKTAPVINIVSPSDGAVAADETLTITGTVSDALSGVESVTCNGERASISGTSFTCEQQLVAGDNQITVEATDRAGNRASSGVNVTWQQQEGGSFSDATLRPNVIFVGESKTVTFTAKIPYEGTTAPTVRLLRLGGAPNATEGMLVDDGGGDAGSGDAVSGDRIFTFRQTYTAESEGQLRFRVNYQKDGRDVYSQVLPLGFHKHLTDAQISSILSTQQSAATLYESLAASIGIAQAREAVLAELRQKPEVLKAGVVGDETGISVLYAPGITATIDLLDPHIAGGNVSNATPPKEKERAPGNATPLPATTMNATATKATVPLMQNEEDEDEDENRIKNKRALIYAAMNTEFGHYTKDEAIRDLLTSYSCDYEVDYLSDDAANLESFKNLERYGVIMVSSHGGLKPFETAPYAALHGLPAGQPVYQFLSGEEVNPERMSQYDADLFAGLIGIASSPFKTYFSILPPFVSFYSSTGFPNSLVYMETCRSAANDAMAQKFFSLGAKTYLGYTKTALNSFIGPTGFEFFKRFFGEPSRKAGGPDGAYIPEQYDPIPCTDRSNWTQLPKCEDPAERERILREEGARFTMFGSEELEKPEVLDNGGFEKGDLQGWDYAFDSRAVGQLGNISPVSGDYMGMVSKSTTWFAVLEQDFCLPSDAKRVEFDWNLITEQSCGSAFFEPDVLWIRIKGPGLYHQVLTTGVRQQCGLLRPTTADLPSPGSARATGWQHASIDITSLAQTRAGQTLTLSFQVQHAVFNGDIFTDSAVLIDNVRIVK
ncbi:MAG TPA: hypothetical protein VJS44_22290 [Pyrinomonadaceae bacterium]|nr:hypothetical protein [Pyrinomonadaceae bacterium]